MKRAGRCAEKHTPSSAPDLGDGRDDPAKAAAQPDGDPLTASLPCSSRNSSVSALTAALGCSLRASMVDPERNPLSGLVDTRPAFHSGPKTILPPEGKDAATTARCSSSAPSNSGTETSQAACGWPKSPPTAPPTSDTSSKPPPIPTPRENRRLVRLRCGPRRSPQCPCRREDRRSPRPAVDPPSLLQPQRMGARRLPRAASQASAGLSR